MNRTHKPREQVFAVIRLDGDMSESEHAVTVKEIVRSQVAAEAEVERLNTLNAGKSCRYFWQPTRLFELDETPGRAAD